MLAIPRMLGVVGPRRIVRAKIWAVRNYTSGMLAHPLQAANFVLLDPELDNFTYDIANRDELCDFIAGTLNQDRDTVAGYIREIEDDASFRNELNAKLRMRRDRKSVALYGRRVGWYCIVRCMRSRVVIETGVHDGLGSSVLLQALYRNRAEGHEGQLFGIDINPKAGWLIPDRLRDHMTLLIEDSAVAVPRIASEQAVDLFIHDSDHSYAHELKEFQTVASGLAPAAIVLSDNSHVTTALKDFAAASGRSYAFWQEKPENHFYPGSGIGVSCPQ
jgi:hypothetical protein